MKDNQKLSKEQSFFLQALSDYVNGTATQPPKDADIALLTDISNKHQLSPIIYFQTHIPSMQPSYGAAFYYTANRKKIFKELDSEFRKNGVDYLIFKGMEIARYYRHPHLRTSGDIDILVHPSEKERAGQILESIGFKATETKGSDHEWIYMKGPFEIELHHRLLYDDDMNSDTLTAFTDKVWGYTSVAEGTYYRMEPEFHFVYLLLHLRKHFLCAGVGIRQFLDLAVMMKNGELDYDKIEKYIDSCDSMKFAKICFAFIERWLGISCPIMASHITDEFFVSSTITILSGGVFGDNSMENAADNTVENAIRKHGRLSAIVHMIFPGCKQMKNNYPQMGQHKLLLPLLWLHRMAKSLFIKRTATCKIKCIGRHLYMGKLEQERENTLRTWGL